MPSFLLLPIACGSLAACASYRPAPVDPRELLVELETVRWTPQPETDAAAPSPEALAAFAVTHNPELRAERARVGIAGSLLVEAGLLEDPQVGWDGMDALASQLVDGTAGPVEFLSGFGLSIPLPRPGERDAREGAARWRLEEARRQLLEAEWRLVRDVHLAALDLAETEEELALQEDLERVASTTSAWFERARDAGTATAIQAGLASVDEAAVRGRALTLAAAHDAARRRLAALLGLPPDGELPGLAAPGAPAEPPPPADDLVQLALGQRPDLAALEAAYRAAEEELRLAFAQRWPRIAVGTGITLVPRLLTRGGRPAIATAAARRAVLAEEVRALVHRIRREVHEAHAAAFAAEAELRFVEEELEPRAERNLELAREAFAVGEVTVVEILTLQRALVDARSRSVAARAERTRRRVELEAVSGTLLR